jgi:hypothetical protein
MRLARCIVLAGFEQQFDLLAGGEFSCGLEPRRFVLSLEEPPPNRRSCRASPFCCSEMASLSFRVREMNVEEPDVRCRQVLDPSASTGVTATRHGSSEGIAAVPFSSVAPCLCYSHARSRCADSDCRCHARACRLSTSQIYARVWPGRMLDVYRRSHPHGTGRM